MKKNYISYIINILITINILSANSYICSICLKPLGEIFSTDAWGNHFHTTHEKEGIFCNSCSRIISEKITQGGYLYNDGRHLCSLCAASSIKDENSINKAYNSVINQLSKIGIINIPNEIEIKLLNFNELNNKAGKSNHPELKGFTKLIINNQFNVHQIFILSALPKIEFEAILAHELLHIWIHYKNINLSSKFEEAFCDLGKYLIYNNDQTQFSSIHLLAMNKNNSLHNKEYITLKNILNQYGWEYLIRFIININIETPY